MITTILNVYRRPYYLKEQIEAIRNQTIKTDEIWIWINKHEDNDGFDFESLGVDKIVRSNHNFKYHGRFALGLLAQTPYVSFFDDDTIPGDQWYENCMNQSRFGNFILGGAGVILNSRQYSNHERVGWPSANKSLTRVDLVGHAWFLPKKSLLSMWNETPYLNNGEDIQLSFNAQKYANIETYCPPHPIENKRLWSSLSPIEKGNDNKASSNGSIMPVNEFYLQRDNCVGYAIDNGWITVRGVK